MLVTRPYLNQVSAPPSGVPNPTFRFVFDNPTSASGITTSTDSILGLTATSVDANMNYISDGASGFAVNVINASSAGIDLVSALDTIRTYPTGTVLIRAKNVAISTTNLLLSTGLTSANNRYFSLYPDRVQVRNNNSGSLYDLTFNTPVTYDSANINSFVFRSSTINVACEAFLNGVQRTATSSPANISSTNYWFSSFIGASNTLDCFRRYVTSLQTSATTNAEIHEVSYWNIPLTNSEILSLG
jgi:hypothetical protein